MSTIQVLNHNEVRIQFGQGSRAFMYRLSRSLVTNILWEPPGPTLRHIITGMAQTSVSQQQRRFRLLNIPIPFRDTPCLL